MKAGELIVAKELKVLDFDAKCADCGADLPKGSLARVYIRSDGTVTIYGVNCHVNKGLGLRLEEIPPNVNLTDILMELKAIHSTLAKIHFYIWQLYLASPAAKNEPKELSEF